MKKRMNTRANTHDHRWQAAIDHKSSADVSAERVLLLSKPNTKSQFTSVSAISVANKRSSESELNVNEFMWCHLHHLKGNRVRSIPTHRQGGYSTKAINHFWTHFELRHSFLHLFSSETKIRFICLLWISYYYGFGWRIQSQNVEMSIVSQTSKSPFVLVRAKIFGRCRSLKHTKCIWPVTVQTITRLLIFWWHRRRCRARPRPHYMDWARRTHRSRVQMWRRAKLWSCRCGTPSTAVHRVHAFYATKCPTFTRINWRISARRTHWPWTWDEWANSFLNLVSMWYRTIGRQPSRPCYTRRVERDADRLSICAKTPQRNWKTRRNSNTSKWNCTRSAARRTRCSPSGWAAMRPCCIHRTWWRIIRKDDVNWLTQTPPKIRVCRRAHASERSGTIVV